jgi:hypothetical protein
LAGFYTYSKSTDEVYKLTSLDNGETRANMNSTGFGKARTGKEFKNDTIIEKKKSSLASTESGGSLATIGSNTKVIVYDGDAYTVYSGGLANMPTISQKVSKTGEAAIYCVMEKEGGEPGSKAQLVYIDVKASEWMIEDSSTKEYFYIYTTDKPGSTRANGEDLYTYTVASDGGTKKITFNSEVKNDMEGSGTMMYRITRTDKNGNITGVSPVEKGTTKGVIALVGADEIANIDTNGISSEAIKFKKDMGGVDSVSITDKTVITRVQGKEVNGGTGGSNLSSVKSYLEKEQKEAGTGIKELYIFYNSDGDAEKVYVVLAEDKS